MGLTKRMLWLVNSMKVVCQKYGGKVPERRDDLIKLPGVGHYTASAVLCFGFKKDIPIVDTNVVRVLTRILDIPKPCKVTDAVIQETARKLVPKGRGVAYNEALLDFAAIVCKKRPKCDICPISEACEYHKRIVRGT